MELSDNEIVTLLLCSDLALSGSAVPFTDVVYSEFAHVLFKIGKQPADLYTMNEYDIDEFISLSEKLCKFDAKYKFAVNIPKLLKRHQQLLIELGMLERYGINVITRANRKYYPSKIINKLSAAGVSIPAVIYYAGNLSLIDSFRNIAIVGSRNLDADQSAEFFTKIFVERAVMSDYGISSGGAKGIDICSQKAVISNNGRFIITVSDSLLKKIVDPDVRHGIQNGNGLFLSLVNPKERFKSYNAMARNKIIYSVSDYALVVTSEYQTKFKNGIEVIDDNKGGTWVGAHECFKKHFSKLLIRSNGQFTSRGNRKMLDTLDVIEVDEQKFLSDSNMSVNFLLNG